MRRAIPVGGWMRHGRANDVFDAERRACEGTPATSRKNCPILSHCLRLRWVWFLVSIAPLLASPVAIRPCEATSRLGGVSNGAHSINWLLALSMLGSRLGYGLGKRLELAIRVHDLHARDPLWYLLRRPSAFPMDLRWIVANHECAIPLHFQCRSGIGHPFGSCVVYKRCCNDGCLKSILLLSRAHCRGKVDDRSGYDASNPRLPSAKRNWCTVPVRACGWGRRLPLDEWASPLAIDFYAYKKDNRALSSMFSPCSQGRALRASPCRRGMIPG
ncbi:hypothetical protein Sjap_026053 [Stephania japonica]|uniref:Uncharacterized protein n=1 Tax=Stephania japonica TaxID=461633 RepID=A0AAP0E6B0_9MAGN